MQGADTENPVQKAIGKYQLDGPLSPERKGFCFSEILNAFSSLKSIVVYQAETFSLILSKHILLFVIIIC